MVWKFSKKKGFTAMVLGIVLLGLVACGGDNTGDDGSVTLTFSHWGGEETYTEVYEARIAEFEKQNPDIKIDVLTVADGYDTKIQTMMVGGESPDVVQLAEALPQYAMKNQLLDLSEYISEAGINLEGNWGDSITQYQVNGGTYGMPDRGGPMILYYNKDIFDAAGLDYPDENWTEADLQNALEVISAIEDDEIAQWAGSWLNWFPQWGNELKRNGGSIIENGEIAINSPQNLEALEKYNQNYQNGFMLTYEEIEASTQPNGDGIFAQGKMGMLMTGFWNIASFTKVDDLNFDIAPVWSGANATTWPFGSALTISRDSKHPEEAWRFIEFMTGYEGQTILGEKMGDCPGHLGVLNSDEFINRQVNGKGLNLGAIGLSAERVVIDELFQEEFYGEVSSVGSDLVQEMLLGRLTPKETLEELERRMETIIADYR